MFRDDKVEESIDLGPDIMEIARSWDELSPLFYTDYTLANLAGYDIKIPASVRNAAGMGWDIFKSVALSIDEYKKINHLKYATRHQKEKGARLACNAVIKDLSNSSKLISLLTMTGVLAGVASTAATASIAIGIASASWGVAALSCARLDRAIKKSQDPAFWFKETLENYRHLQKDIKLYEKKLASLNNAKKIKKVEKEMAHLQEKCKELKYRAVTIAKVKFTAEAPLSAALKEKFRLIMKDHDVEKLSPATVTLEDKKIIYALEKNQQEATIARAANTIALVTTAIGTTLLALSPFTGPAAPAVMTAGFAFVGAGIVMDVGRLIVTKLVNKYAKNQQKKALINEYQNKGLLNNEELDHRLTLKDKFKFRCSFELSKAAFAEDRSNKDLDKTAKEYDSQLETRWYQALFAMEDKKENKKAKDYLLHRAETKIIDQVSLNKVFQGADTSPLSAKTKETIINRQRRSQLMTSIQSGFKSLFFKKEPAKEEVAVTSFNLKPSHIK